MDSAAITDPALCTNVGGVWKQPKCSVSSQLECDQHGGQWRSAEQWTLKGGVDLLIVGLLQVELYHHVLMLVALLMSTSVLASEPVILKTVKMQQEDYPSLPWWQMAYKTASV